MVTGPTFKTSGPVTLPASGLHTAAKPRPAARLAAGTSWDILADLAAQLRARGVTARRYAAAGPDRAVLSLPQHPAS